MEEAKEGWTYLGTYYFSEGATKVELTDKSKGKIVYADAVKWVKQGFIYNIKKSLKHFDQKESRNDP